MFFLCRAAKGWFVPRFSWICALQRSLESTGHRENACATLLCSADSDGGSPVLRYDPWSFGRIADVPRPKSLDTGHYTRHGTLKHSEAARQTNTNKAQGLNRAHSPPMVLPELWFIHVYLWLHPRRGRQGKSKIQAFVYLQCSSEAKSVKQLRQLGRARGWHDDLHDAIGEGSTCHLRATNPPLSSASRRVKVPACKFPRRSQLGENLVWSHAKICALGSRQSWPKSPSCWDHQSNPRVQSNWKKCCLHLAVTHGYTLSQHVTTMQVDETHSLSILMSEAPSGFAWMWCFWSCRIGGAHWLRWHLCIEGAAREFQQIPSNSHVCICLYNPGFAI